MTERTWPPALAFAVNGGIYGGLLSRYAELADGAGADAAAFGLALTAGALGGLAGSAGAPLLVRRRSEQATTTVAGLAYAALALAIPLAPTAPALAVAFFAVGAVDGTHDVSVNALAVRYQQRVGRPLMGRMHAVWSLALALGAAAGAVAAATGVPPVAHLAATSAVLGLAQLVAGRAGRRADAPHRAAARHGPLRVDRSTGSGPRRTLAAVVLAAVAASYVEGPGQDWSTLVVSDLFGAGNGAAAAAPFAFSSGLLLARLLLDPLRLRVRTGQVAVGATTVVVVGAVAGTVAAHLHAPAPAALAAFALIGFGAGPVYPMLFDTADVLGARHGISPATTAGIISTCSRVGAISAPLLVGQLAHATGLAVVLQVITAAGALALLTLPSALRR